MQISETCRGALALALGCLSCVSIPAQTEWSLATLPHTGHPIAFDAARGRTVLFGAMTGTRGGQQIALTWEWDGTAWTRRLSATTPPARTEHAMAYDSARGRLVLFGGTSGGSLLADTWEWDGADWTLRTPAVSPPARRAHTMVYDSARGRVVLFGGNETAFGTVPIGDTWEWDGTSWIASSPPASPALRHDHAMAYDPMRNRTVLFGGIVAPGTSRGGVWEWDGTNWVQAGPNPPGFGGVSFAEGFAWDSVTGAVLTYDPPANAAGVTVTNGGRAGIGL